VAWTVADIPDQRGRIAVITGANGGLGFETARELARAGAHVVMAVRSPEKGEAARREILEEVPSASLELRPIDLASQDSVRACAAGVLEAHPSVDVLVNNAGVMAVPEATTEDGHELQFGVNHLGHFLLTSRLLPALLRSADPRVVAVTSTGRHYAAELDENGPVFGPRGYDPWRAYGLSKRANLQFAVELQRRANAAGLRMRSLGADPGFSDTDLQAHGARTSGGRSQRFFRWAVRRFGADPHQGALPQLRAATDPDARGGSLYVLRWIVGGPPVSRPASGKYLQPGRLRYVWEVSEHLIGERFGSFEPSG